MLLVVSIPDQNRFDPASTAAWSLFDGSGALLRAGRDRLDKMPRAEQRVATVPAGRIAFIETPLPAVGSAKREALLRYAIEDKLTIDPATIHAAVIGVSQAAAANAQVRATAPLHIVAAIDRAWFAAALAWLQSADRAPSAVYAETDAVAVAPGEWALVMGSQGSARSAATDKVDRASFARRDDGYAYALDAAAGDAPPFALRLALGEVVHPPTRITVYVLEADAGGSQTTAAITAARIASWQAALAIPLRDGGVLTAAILGKRLMQLKSGNLLTQEFTPRRAASAWAARLRPALTVLALIAVLQLVFTVADFWRLERQQRALEAALRATFQAAFPQASVIVDAPLQMQRNLADLKRARGLARDDDVRLLLAQLAAITRSQPRLEIVEVAINHAGAGKDNASLRGKLSNAADLAPLRQLVQGTPGAELLAAAGADAAAAVPIEIIVKAPAP